MDNSHDTDRQQIEALQRRVEELAGQLEQLTRILAPVQPAAPEAATPAADDEELRSSRRGLLKLAGAAVAGAAASGIAAAPAAATDGEAVTLGQWKTATTNRTRADYTGGLSGGQAFLFQAGSSQDGNAGFVSAALAGWTTVAGMPNGIYGYSSLAAGKGIYGRADGTGATAGVHGLASSGSGVGVLAENNTANAVALSASSTGLNGVGVYAKVTGSWGVGVYAQAEALHATAVYAVGNFAGVSAAGEHAVVASGTIYGLWATGGKAALFMPPGNEAPPAGEIQHSTGEMTVDMDGTLWFCSIGGTPGTWQKLGGPGTGGSFHPISPSRVYDSRKPTANPITSGGTRLVSVADKIDATGTIVTPDIVPAGATAIAYNLTIVNTVGTNGYLAVNPGGNTTVSASSINWSAPNLTLANGSVVTLNNEREVTVICGGSSTRTNFIIDVVGYYR